MSEQSYLLTTVRSGNIEEAAELVHRYVVMAILELNRPQQMRCTLDTLVGDKAKLIVQVSRIVEMAAVEESRLLLMQIYLVFQELKWAKVYNLQTELKRSKPRALTLVYAK